MQDETAIADGAADPDILLVGQIDSVPEILQAVCQMTGMGFAAIARVTEDRWLACQVLDTAGFGIGVGRELPIETTLCNEVRDSREVIVFDDAATDPVYARHHTPALYGLRSYISVPIILGDGSFFGTLCAIDTRPASLTQGPVVATFRLFAQLIARHIDDRRAVQESRAVILEMTEMAELRDQFIAVLGHDLRNPMMAFMAGMNLLSRQPQTERAETIIGALRQTTDRMTLLVENMLDFARGRLGGGIVIERDADRPVERTLEEIVAETKAAYPERSIVMTATLDRGVPVDHARIGQMFSNLLGNAITHGSSTLPIRIEAKIDGGRFLLSVANGGAPIPPDVQSRLFQPFYRGSLDKRSDGLGLGLYIASQIAQAHGGTIDVSSDADETRFTFAMPLG